MRRQRLLARCPRLAATPITRKRTTERWSLRNAKIKKKIANITKQYIQGIVAAWLSRSMPLHEKTNINNVIRPHVRVRINSIGFSFILHTANSCVCVVFMTPEDIYFISSVVVRNKKKILITLWYQHIIIWQTITIPSPKKKQDVYKWICITLLFDWHRRHTRYHKVAKNAANCSKQETISHNKQYFCVQ